MPPVDSPFTRNIETLSSPDMLMQLYEGGLKFVVIVMFLLFVLFAIVVLRQVIMMAHTIKTPLDTPLRIFATAQLIVTSIVLLVSFLVL